MNSNDPFSTNERQARSDAEAEAMDWFFMRRKRRLTAVEQADFQTWLDAKPENADEYAQFEAIWDELGELPEAARKVVSSQADAPSARPLKQPSFFPVASIFRWPVAAISCVMLLVCGWFSYQYVPLESATAMTGPEETSELKLSDGTLIHANVNTQLTVRYTLAKREIHLERGEVLVDVAPDRRPMTTWAGDARIRDIGTQFNVLALPDLLEVSVRSGLVALTPDISHSRTEYQLQPGDIASLPLAHGVVAPRMTHGQPSASGSWREGILIVNAEPLQQVLSKLKPYRATPLVLADERVQGLKVSGTVDLRRPDAFLRALPTILPGLKLDWDTGGTAKITFVPTHKVY